MVDCKDAPSAIFLMGPTASGKTNLAMQLYDKIPCELISVDSALIYRDMNIGTAKPTQEELEKYPHHLVNIIDPSESYSAAQFRIDTLQLMEQITARGNTPVLVGGTMMYFNALRHGLASLPQADETIRQRITEMAEDKGWPSVHARLREVDPESAERLEVNDSQRVQRALEVYELTGVTLTEHWAKQKSQTLPYNVLNLAVMPADRKILHERIQLRFNQMLEQGFEEEVKSLFARGDLNLQMPSMRCVGYRQMWMYLTGEYDFDTMRDKGVIATRQLAKRQVTWLRSWDDLHWLDPQATDLLDRALKLLDSSTI